MKTSSATIIFTLLVSTLFSFSAMAEIIPTKMPPKPELNLSIENDIIPTKMPPKPELNLAIENDIIPTKMPSKPEFSIIS